MSSVILGEWSEEELRERYSRCLYFPDLTPSPELSYILGVRYGDLGKHPGSVILNTIDEDFAEELARCAGVVMSGVYKVKPTLWRKGTFRVQVSSKVLVGFLYDLSFTDHKVWIEYYPADFLRGFFDSEGSAGKYNAQIRARNTNKDVLVYTKLLLKTYFDIHSTVTTPPSALEQVGKTYYLDGRPITTRKVAHYIYISNKDNVEKFYWNISFSIRRKNERLEKALWR